MLELLPEFHEFNHRLLLELLDVLVLLLQLPRAVVFECAKLQRLVGALCINLLLQLVLGIVDFLENVFLSFNTCCHLPVELILQFFPTS